MEKIVVSYKVLGKNRAMSLFKCGTTAAYVVMKQIFMNFVLLRVSHNVCNGLEPNVKSVIDAFLAHYGITEKEWAFDAAYRMYQRLKKDCLDVPIKPEKVVQKIDKAQAKIFRKIAKVNKNTKKNVSTPLNAPKKRRRGRKKAENSLQIRFI